MEFEFEGRAIVRLKYTPGDASSEHVSTRFKLDVSGNLDHSKYLDEENLPTKDGAKMLTQAFVQGLVRNIHHAHQKGYWNDAEHLRYIIAELEKGFVQITEVGTGTY